MLKNMSTLATIGCITLGVASLLTVASKRPTAKSATTSNERPVSTTETVTQTEQQIAPLAPPQKQIQVTVNSASLPAIVEPARQALMTATMLGVVTRVMVKEGDTVSKGQLLAVIDDQVAEVSVKVARATAENSALVRTAEVELRVAESDLARLESVKDRRAIAAVQIERARANVELAQVGLERAHEEHKRAKLELELQKARLETHNVRAPFDGVIQRLDIEAGQSLSLGQGIVQIADISRLRAELFVGVGYFNRINVGDECSLTGAAPVNQVMTGRLASIDPVINAATNTFRCVFEVENPEMDLPAGFKVTFNGPGVAAQTAHASNNNRQ